MERHIALGPQYLLPVEKWHPIYWPNETWQVVPLPAYDEFGVRKRPVPPDGTLLRWWQLPKDQWPLYMPWEPKIFGAWPASKITMAEDLVGHPPFGFIKIKMPGPPSVSGYQGPKGNQIPFVNMKMHMRHEYVMHYANRMKMRSYTNAFGELKFTIMNQNWEEAEYDAQQYRDAFKAMKRAKVMQMIAEEIARTRGIPKPSVDLFS